MFPTHSFLPDVRNERRWQILSPLQRTSASSVVALWKVHDRRLRRQALLACLDYSLIPADRLPWDVLDLRKSFESMVKALSCNAPNLPEPLDFFLFRHPSLPPAVADGEPALILSPLFGQPLPPPALSDPQTSPKRRSDILRRITLRIAHSLRDLHQRGLLLRSLPQSGIFQHPSTQAILFSSFQTLLPSRDFRGFQPHTPAIHPLPRHAAPECFHEHPSLGPATDIYALGRLLIEILGETLPERPFSSSEIEAFVAKYSLEPYWLRFFQLALHPLPEQRFSGTSEVISFVTSKGDSRPTPASPRPPSLSPSLRTQRSDAPPAALLIWSPFLYPQGKRFDYKAFLASLQSRFSLKSLLFFAPEQPDPNNSFFQFLRLLSFEILTFPRHTPTPLFIRNSAARWSSLPNLLLLGSHSQDACREILRIALSSNTPTELFSSDPLPPSNVLHRPIEPFLSNAKDTTRRR